MSNSFEKVSEKASIVVLGNLNPRIFHPSWLIGKGLVEDWDYFKDNLTILPDLARFSLPGQIDIQVLLNQFTITTNRASAFPQLKDLASGIFSILSETPIDHLGMNYHLVVHFTNKEKWKDFGRSIAPKEEWKEYAGYLNEPPFSESEELGIWDITMHLPRPDSLKGYLHPRIQLVPPADQMSMDVSVNSHVVMNDLAVSEVLEQCWDDALKTSNDIVNKILEKNS